MSIVELSDSRLRALDDLYWDAEQDFRRGLEALMQSEHKRLVIDLTAVSFLFSPVMGHIVRFSAEAQQQGKEVEILLNEHLAEFFKASGLADELPVTMVARNSH